MADLHLGDDPEVQKLGALVISDPDQFEHWEKLVRAAEGQEGGINRNSSPNAIAATRDIYDRFLARFPLFHGFWKRYADLEFAVAGTEAAEMVYERGTASISNSVDLWANYCAFKVETSHDSDVIRELFERGAESVGLDFLAHPFWDKYIEFEERLEEHGRIFKILSRIVHLSLHQYSRYYERYRAMSAHQSITDLATPQVIAQLQESILHDGGGVAKMPAEMEREMRSKLDALSWEIFHGAQAEVTKRWTYEQNIKRPYYHVTDLDEEQIENWRKYLDFEEAENDYIRVKFLYERCLVTSANYDEFWFRYARWMTMQEGKKEEVRNIYQRASCLYIPISRPTIRLFWAKFEEANGRADIAIAIHEAVLMWLPSHLETMKSLLNLIRRQHGIDAAIEALRGYLVDPACSTETQGALVAEWARMVWRGKGDVKTARELFQKHQSQYPTSPAFWTEWLRFEVDIPPSENGQAAQQAAQHERVKAVHTAIHHDTSLSTELIKELSMIYSQYLDEKGGENAMRDLLELDALVNGPKRVQETQATDLPEKNPYTDTQHNANGYVITKTK